jgi:hypothetical protein
LSEPQFVYPPQNGRTPIRTAVTTENQTTQFGERSNPEAVEELFLSLSEQHNLVSKS